MGAGAARLTTNHHNIKEHKMTIQKLNPYILLNGTTEKAIKLYKSALGAKTENITRYGEGKTIPPEHKDLIMHPAIRIGEGVVMLSDATPDRPAPTGGNVQITLQFAELPGMEKAFDALAAGGRITLPLQDMFWGARFGMLTDDAYSVQWMFNCESKKA
jgi:PhnB protein